MSVWFMNYWIQIDLFELRKIKLGGSWQWSLSMFLALRLLHHQEQRCSWQKQPYFMFFSPHFKVDIFHKLYLRLQRFLNLAINPFGLGSSIWNSSIFPDDIFLSCQCSDWGHYKYKNTTFHTHKERKKILRNWWRINDKVTFNCCSRWKEQWKKPFLRLDWIWWWIGDCGSLSRGLHVTLLISSKLLIKLSPFCLFYRWKADCHHIIGGLHLAPSSHPSWYNSLLSLNFKVFFFFQIY